MIRWLKSWLATLDVLTDRNLMRQLREQDDEDREWLAAGLLSAGERWAEDD